MRLRPWESRGDVGLEHEVRDGGVTAQTNSLRVPLEIHPFNSTGAETFAARVSEFRVGWRAREFRPQAGILLLRAARPHSSGPASPRLCSRDLTNVRLSS